jgi:YD repeat-containing protein
VRLSFEYDELNRIRRKRLIADPQAVTGQNVGSVLALYTYDETDNRPYSKGKLTSVQDEHGRKFFYHDRLGRVTREVQELNNVYYTIETAYDAMNRTTRLTYPSDRVVKYFYNEAGQLSRVTNTAETEIYAFYPTYNALGQPLELRQANGNTRTHYTYEPLKHVLGDAPQFKSAKEAVEAGYKQFASDPNFTDQYLPPFVVVEGGKPIGPIVDGDSVALLNFRGDRAMELSIAFDKKDGFDRFDRVRYPDVKFAGMMEYDGDLHIPGRYLVTPPRIDHPISSYMCAMKIPAFAVSETQKYGHVTYFWNGNLTGYVCESLEKYVEIPSDNIPFDQAPKMKAYEITDATIDLLKSGKYQFGRINFPNGDMVGHTGVPDAIIASVEATDICVQKLIDTVNALGGITVVLADHGNADEMFVIEKGKKKISTAHSLNPVPFAIIDSGYKGEYKLADVKNKGLANVASTLLNLLGYEKPADYEPSLIEFIK